MVVYTGTVNSIRPIEHNPIWVDRVASNRLTLIGTWLYFLFIELWRKKRIDYLLASAETLWHSHHTVISPNKFNKLSRTAERSEVDRVLRLQQIKPCQAFSSSWKWIKKQNNSFSYTILQFILCTFDWFEWNKTRMPAILTPATHTIVWFIGFWNRKSIWIQMATKSRPPNT